MTDDKRELTDQQRRSKVLRERRQFFFIPLFMILAIYLLDLTNFFSIYISLAFGIGYTLGKIGYALFQEKYPKHIYAYSLNENALILSLVTTLGREIIVPIPLNTIRKVKYRKGHLWLHLTGEVKEFYLKDILYGQELLYQLNVEKI